MQSARFDRYFDETRPPSFPQVTVDWYQRRKSICLVFYLLSFPKKGRGGVSYDYPFLCDKKLCLWVIRSRRSDNTENWTLSQNKQTFFMYSSKTYLPLDLLRLRSDTALYTRRKESMSATPLR